MKKFISFWLALIMAFSILALPEKAEAATYIMEPGNSRVFSDENYHNAIYHKTWTSSNPSVASVYGSGIHATVTAHTPGVAIITCQTSAEKTVYTSILGADGNWYQQANTYHYSATSTRTIRVVEKVTVTFDGNGGDVSQKSMRIEKNTAIGSLPDAERAEYVFKGWYSIGGVKQTTTSKYTADTVLTAKWSKAAPGKVSDFTMKAGYKQLDLNITKLANADGYQITYSTKKDFSNALSKRIVKTSGTLKELKAGTRYYVKVRGYRYDSTGTRRYGSYSAIKTITTPKYVISDSKVILYPSQSQTIKLQGAGGKETYVSSNPSIAKVSSSGKITALKKGTVTITAKYKSQSFACKVTVEDPKLNRTSLRILTKQSYQLKLKNTSQNVTFTSADENIASVSSSGLIEAKTAGTVIITAKANGKSFPCKVIVEKPSFSTREKTLITDETYTIRISNTKFEPTFLNQTPELIDVTAKGAVTTKKTGDALVHVVLNDKKYAVKFHIENPEPGFDSYTMSQGTIHTYKLNTTLPVTYASSDASIVSVDENGQLSGSQCGSAIVTATVRGRAYPITVNVEAPYPETVETTVNVEDSFPLKVNGSTRSIIGWRYDSEMITYDGGSIFTAIKAGYTTVYAVLENNDEVPFEICSVGVSGTITNPYYVTSFTKDMYRTDGAVKLENEWLGNYTYEVTACESSEDTLILNYNVTLNEENTMWKQTPGYSSVTDHTYYHNGAYHTNYYYDELGYAYELELLTYALHQDYQLDIGDTINYELKFKMSQIQGDYLIVPFRTKPVYNGSFYTYEYEYYAFPVERK